jgi:hypothetical protein
VAARSPEPIIRTRAAAEIKGSTGGPPVPGSALAEADSLGLIIWLSPIALALIIWSSLIALAEDEALDMALAEDEALDIMVPSPIILSSPICCAIAAGAKSSATNATNMAR